MLNLYDDINAKASLEKIKNDLYPEMAKVIIGQKEVIDHILISLLAGGHSLINGVPGLGKTLLVSTLAKLLDLSFKRIQFTPDLMPADITGTNIIEEDPITRTREFKFIKGPIFANVILADEINRTPPKTQSALLQAMQEREITYGGKTYPLELPFFVLATQNPIEQEGTYPLPEAQLDRFMFLILMNYPETEDEITMVELTTSREEVHLNKVLNSREVLAMQSLVKGVPVAREVIEKAVKMVKMTRPEDPLSPDLVRRWVKWGAGPRASQNLILAAKARALITGKAYVSTEDVLAMAYPVLRHRIIVNYIGEAEGINADKIIRMILELMERKNIKY